MAIVHTTPDEMIKLQQSRIDALAAEVLRLRSYNHTLAALNLKLSTTDLTAAEMAQTLIAGCPQWVEVTAHLIYARIMLEVPRRERDDFVIAN